MKNSFDIGFKKYLILIKNYYCYKKIYIFIIIYKIIYIVI